MSPHLLVCGAPGVGTSTVAFPLMLRIAGRGSVVTYLDLHQLGFSAPATAADVVALRARNLAAVWAAHREAGAELLVACAAVSGPDEVAAYTDALGAARTQVLLLDASPATLDERVLGRRLRETLRLPGPTLVGRSESDLRAHARASARISRALVRSGVADVVVPTDGLTADQVTDALDAAAG